jgi:hypothetical protein
MYIEMHQKYLDEKRDKELSLATMREDFDTESLTLREECDLFKERVRLMEAESQRLVQAMHE